MRDRGRGYNVPGGGTPEQDFGAARLCRGLLEQCDLCVDAVRGLCAAVSREAKPKARRASSSDGYRDYTVPPSTIRRCWYGYTDTVKKWDRVSVFYRYLNTKSTEHREYGSPVSVIPPCEKASIRLRKTPTAQQRSHNGPQLSDASIFYRCRDTDIIIPCIVFSHAPLPRGRGIGTLGPKIPPLRHCRCVLVPKSSPSTALYEQRHVGPMKENTSFTAL